MQPLVSVIIPVYNVKDYLCESLDSIVNQTYKNLDIVIIDDGSTDGSDLICDRYKRMDSRIRVIHQKNRGLSAARNTGLDYILGDVISFLDSDDAFELNMIELMIEGMLKTQSDIAICSYNFVYNEIKGHSLNQIIPFCIKQGVISSKEALFLLFEGKINYGVWNKLYKRQIFEKIRFPEGHVYEDNYVIPEVIEKAKNVVVIGRSLIRYRKHLNSITTTYSDKNSLDWLRAKNKLESFVRDRTPGLFSWKQMSQFQEKSICDLIRYYLELFSHERGTSTFIKQMFEKEINVRARNIQAYSIKTKMLYYTFKFNPYLCIYLRCFYNMIKKTDRRIPRRRKNT